MAKDKSLSKSSIVNVMPIEANIDVNGDHVVALMVSQAEESINKKIDDMQKAHTEACEEMEKVQGRIEKALTALENQKVAAAKKSGVLDALKSLGFKKPDIKIGVGFTSDGQKLNVETNIFEGDHRSSLHTHVAVALPKNVSTLAKQLSAAQDRKNQLSRDILECKTYRQNELPGLERWAKGQIAAAALKKAGGDMRDFVSNLEDMMPGGLQKLLQ